MDKKIVNIFFIGLIFGMIVMGIIKINNKSEKIKEIVDEESVVIKVVEQATPSVVTISMNETKQDVGTGFVISDDGLIVTNKHVVIDLQAKYRVIIGKDEILEVKQIYRDPLNDLAILKVEKTDLIPVAMGDSDKIKVGQSVIAIGTALGEFRSTVTTGVISGLGRGITAGLSVENFEKLENVIQTDAAINPGNSGGPLLNSSGEVIGVNVAVSQAGQNIGFALPINIVRESIDNFRETGEFERPYLGVGYQMVKSQGAYVKNIIKGGPAEKAGIQIGDIITKIDGVDLREGTDSLVVTIVSKNKIGDEIEAKVLREKEELILKIRLEKRN